MSVPRMVMTMRGFVLKRLCPSVVMSVWEVLSVFMFVTDHVRMGVLFSWGFMIMRGFVRVVVLCPWDMSELYVIG